MIFVVQLNPVAQLFGVGFQLATKSLVFQPISVQFSKVATQVARPKSWGKATHPNSANANRTSCIRDNTSSDVRSRGEVQLPDYSDGGSNLDQDSYATTFWGAKGIPNVDAMPARWLKKTGRLPWSSLRHRYHFSYAVIVPVLWFSIQSWPWNSRLHKSN